MKTKSKKLLTLLIALCMTLALVPIAVFATDPTIIGNVYFGFETPNYNAGDSPRELASIQESNANYRIYDEYLEEVERVSGHLERTGRSWHSNPVEMSRVASDKQITTMEGGKSYLYYIVFEPESSQYEFDADTTELWLDGNSLGKPQSGLVQMVDSGIRIRYMYHKEVYVSQKIITEAAIENVKFNYQVGEAPQKMASVSNLLDLQKYEVAYECWQEMENGNPVAYWYSDESKYPTSAERITQFEAGKTYMYFIELKAKGGYTFADNCAVTITDTFDDTITVPAANVHKTTEGLFIRAVKEIQPVELQEIPIVEINNVTVTFKDGDTPVFTGTVAENDQYYFRTEWWETEDGFGVDATEFGNQRYINAGKLITAFESGKTYQYGLYFSASPGYTFTDNTKLRINGKLYDYKHTDENWNQDSPEYQQSFWVLTGLTMTPTAGGQAPDSGTETQPTDPTKPAEKKAVDTTSPKTGDDSNLALWIALLFVSGGAVTATTVYSRKKKI